MVSGAINLTPGRWTQRADPDGLLDQARTEYDVAARKKLYAEAQQQIVDDLAIVPLIFSAEYAVMRAAVNGFEWIPDEISRFRGLWKATI